MAKTRNVWGWGNIEDALSGKEIDGLEALVMPMFGGSGQRINPINPDDIRLSTPKLEIPRGISHLFSTEFKERARHTYGRSFLDVSNAMVGDFGGAPDLVCFPETAQDVKNVIEFCSLKRIALVPFGGGSSVVGGVTTTTIREKGYEYVVSLDLSKLNKLLELDKESLSAHFEAGILGPDLEEKLRPSGLTLRHFPQSFEFSSLGGWIATRAGGHFATGYTHIDDYVESLTVQTLNGRYESRRLPASGAGPSPDRFWIGSEGAFGVIVDAWVRVKRRPSFRAKLDVSFTSKECSHKALKSIAQSDLSPANLRLLDPMEAFINGVSDGSKSILLIGFESSDHPVDEYLGFASDIALSCGGITESSLDKGGASESETWKSSFIRAPYLRDALIRLGLIVDTFETAITWDKFEVFNEHILRTANEAVKSVTGNSGIVTMRTTHAYSNGVAPYYSVIAKGQNGKSRDMWKEIKSAVSDAVFESGGTITHHHAVGRDHMKWYEKEVPRIFGNSLKVVKNNLDPNMIFNPGVLV